MKTLSATLLLLLITMPAAAQNHGSQLMGGRTSGMGGAAIAYGDDSAMGFLNPAGLARVSGDVLSLSASAYRWDLYRYDGFFAQQSPPDFAGTNATFSDNELRSSSITALPASVTYMAHFGQETKHVLGFSVLVPRAERRALDGVLRVDSAFVTANASFSTVRSDTTYYIGPSYAVALGGPGTRLMLGASAFVAYTTRTVLTDSDTLAGAVPATEFNLRKIGAFTSANSYDFVGVLGAQLKMGIFSVGLVVHSPSGHIAGGFEQTAGGIGAGNGTLDLPDVVQDIKASGSFEERQPLRVGLGVALEFSRFTIGADVRLMMPLGSYNRFDGTLEGTQLQEGEQPANITEPLIFERRERAVVNAALGLEVRLTDMWTLRAGGFTSFSSSDLSDVDNEPLSSERIDRFGGTLGLGIRLGEVETAVNCVYTGGQGDAIGQDIGNASNASQQRLVTALQSSFAVLISGSVNLESLLGG